MASKQKKIIIYFPRLLSNGTERAILDLIRVVKRNWYIIYSKPLKENDVAMIHEMKKYAKVMKYKDGMKADLVIFATQFHKYKEVIFESPKKYQWVHNMPFESQINAINDPEYTKDIDLFICVSQASADEITYYNPDFKTVVIHNFFDTKKILTGEGMAPNEKVERKPKTITMVCRLSNEKGIYRIPLFINKIPDWRIVIVGGAFDEDYGILLKKFLAPYKNVEFVGFKYSPMEYIKASDYLMVLSTHEGWNRTITEAKMLGIPVISTNFKGVEEQIEDGVNGYIFDMEFERDIRIINNKLMPPPFEWVNEVERWEEIL